MAVVAIDLVIAVSETSLWTTLTSGSLSQIAAALGSTLGENALGLIGGNIFKALIGGQTDADSKKHLEHLERLGKKIVESMRILKLETDKSTVLAIASWWGGLLAALRDMKLADRPVDYDAIQQGFLVQYDNSLPRNIDILYRILQDNCHFVYIKPYSAMLDFLFQTSNMYIALTHMQASFAVLRWNEDQPIFSIPDSYTNADTHPVGRAIISCREWIYEYTHGYLLERSQGVRGRPTPHHPDYPLVSYLWNDYEGDDLMPNMGLHMEGIPNSATHSLTNPTWAYWVRDWGARGGLAVRSITKDWEALRQAIQPGVAPLAALY